ncbi:hypothetical protein [Streptomyces sp. NPDC050982]|uniref:hypothetical protein n=1 Tax=Streptomyces sp. NPDC050982 TaxID=3154746 RepID=UPI0034054BB1
MPGDLCALCALRQVANPPGLVRHRCEPGGPQPRRELRVALACDGEPDAEDPEEQCPHDPGPGEGDAVTTGPERQDDTSDGAAEGPVEHPLLGALSGQVEVDPRLEQLQGVGHEGRQGSTTGGLRKLGPVLSGPLPAVGTGIGHDEHLQRPVVPTPLPHVRVLVPELLRHEGKPRQLLHGRHGTGHLNGFTTRHELEHLLHLAVAHGGVLRCGRVIVIRRAAYPRLHYVER